MTSPTIMLLGGYGNAGLQIARLVLADSDAARRWRSGRRASSRISRGWA